MTVEGFSEDLIEKGKDEWDGLNILAGRISQILEEIQYINEDVQEILQRMPPKVVISEEAEVVVNKEG